jgi:tetratricopeptide (TPR) repeat protein
VIKYHLANNRHERAAELAERAVVAFPALPDPPRYAVAVHSATGRWDKVVEAATVWRERTPGDPVPADIALADALIGKGQRLAAVQALDPHVKANPLPAADPDAAGPATAPGTKPATKPTTGTAVAAPTTQPALKPYVFSLYQTYGRALIGAARPSDAADRLRPLLRLGTQGRLAWLGLATAHRKEDQAARWIEQAAEAVRPTAPVAERLAVADAWLQAGRATGSAALMQRAADALKPMLAGPTASVDTLVLAAYVAHFRGDYPQAERYWRSVRPVSKSPDVPNNLAYALLLSGRDDAVAEARALADEAAAAAPRNPTFLGTQARAMARQGQRDAAIGTYRKVLALDARNVEAMVGLAEELAKGSPADTEEARKLVARARQAVDEDPQPVAPELKKQLEAVRATVEPAEEGK